MLPVDKRYPIDELLEACREYVAVTGRRITFEWALVNGVNDTPEQAHLLASKIKGLLCHVNAIPLNPTQGYSGQATTRERAECFQGNTGTCWHPLHDPPAPWDRYSGRLWTIGKPGLASKGFLFSASGSLAKR